MDIFFKDGLKLHIQEDGFTLWDNHWWIIDASTLPQISVANKHFINNDGYHYNFKWNKNDGVKEEIEDLKKRILDLERRVE